MKRTIRMISVALLVVVLLSCFPLSVFANEADSAQTTENITTDNASAQSGEMALYESYTEVSDSVIGAINEVVELREENVKHFKLPDGTYEAVSYGQAVHRMDSEGVWQDINNDLTLTTIGTKQLYITPDSRVSFDKSENSFTLSENGYSIYMSLLKKDVEDMTLTTEPMEIDIFNSESSRKESYDTLEEAIEVKNRSSIKYSNVMNGTDIEYVMNGNDIKENIIVKSRQNEYEYGFMLALDGLVPTLEDNVIILTDEETNEEKYIIPAPYMFDSNDEYSYEVEYGLYLVEGDKYLLTITADSEWINSEERAFPVTIDPTVQSLSISVYETYVASNNPTTNFGDKIYLTLFNRSNIKSTGLINIALPSIPVGSSSGYIINYSTLYVRYYTSKTTGTVNIGAYKINGSWSENSVTYNTAPNISPTPMSTETMMASSSTTSMLNPVIGSFSVTEAVKPYYDSGAAFYGIALKHTYGTEDVSIRPYEANPDHAPYISVNYEYIGIIDGNYFINNIENQDAWLQVADDAYPNYYTSGVDIEARTSTGEKHQIWHLVYLGNGYYKISPKESGLCLTVRSDKINSNTGSFTLSEWSSANTQQWKITRSDSGNYIFRPRSARNYSTDWCMYAGKTASESEKVRQEAYVNNTTDYRDEWYLTRITTYLGELPHWYSEDSHMIGHWESSPKIYRELRHSEINNYFDESTTAAVNQWNSALGLSMTFVSQSSEANIRYYGVKENDLVYNLRNGKPISPGTYGLTDQVSAYYEGYYTHGDEIKASYVISSARCFLIYRGASEAQSIKTATHELGHALGFFGHIESFDAIMNQGVVGVQNLTEQDYKQLTQVYPQDDNP